MIKGSIFDLDGILVDTEFFQWKSWVEALKPFNVSFNQVEYLNYAGKTGAIIAEELIEKHRLPIDIKSLLEIKENLVLDWIKEKPLKKMFYAKEAINYFKTKGFKVGVASGSPQEELMLKLERANLRKLVDVVASASEVTNGKPAPDVYLLALQRIKLNPDEVVCFEDTEYGTRAAKAAGINCIAIPNEFSQKQDFSQADKRVKDLHEAIEWIKRNYNL